MLRIPELAVRHFIEKRSREAGAANGTRKSKPRQSSAQCLATQIMEARNATGDKKPAGPFARFLNRAIDRDENLTTAQLAIALVITRRAFDGRPLEDVDRTRSQKIEVKRATVNRELFDLCGEPRPDHVTETKNSAPPCFQYFRRTRKGKRHVWTFEIVESERAPALSLAREAAEPLLPAVPAKADAPVETAEEQSKSSTVSPSGSSTTAITQASSTRAAKSKIGSSAACIAHYELW